MSIHTHQNILPARMMARLAVAVLLLSLSLTGAISQAYNLPAVINPSPQSAALTRYGDYPMTGYDGLTDITVPLHTVTGRKLSLPVTMSFHASGRMANEINGVLGMRWTLNCGGLVTRTMKGLPDEWSRLAPFDGGAYHDNYGNNATIEPSFDDLYSACPDGKIGGLGYFDPNTSRYSPIYDSEYDIFSYSLPNGKQGHFILKTVNGAKVAMTIPYEPLKIQITKSSNSNGYIDYLNITDVDGTKYVFGRADASTANAIETNWNCDLVSGQLGAVPTAWYLTKITSSDGTDQISLSYGTQNVTPYNASQTATIYDRLRNDNSEEFWTGGNADPYKEYLKSLLVLWHFEQTDANVNAADPCANVAVVPTLTGIQFNGGSASFTYTAGNLLSEMVINRGTVPYKKAKFDYTKHQGETDIYYLDGLSFYGEGQAQPDGKYNFGYYEGSVESIFTAAKYKDWWGGYQGPNNGNELLPSQSIPISPIPFSATSFQQNIGFGVQRDGDAYSKQIGMLKTITYPTGGQTEFIYEGNMYNYGDAPGLRIGEVISRPVGGKEIHKTYKYGVNEDGYGHINELLHPGSASRTELTTSEGNTMQFWTWNSYTPGTGGGSNPGGSDNWTGYRSTNYLSDPYIGFELGGSPIKYDAVSEYMTEDGIPKQKTQSYYSWGNNEQVSDFTIHDYDLLYHHTRKFADPQNAWLTPVLTNKTLYNYSNGQFSPVRSESYNYTTLPKDEAWDMPTYLHTNIIYSMTSISNLWAPTPTTIMDGYNTAKAYHNTACSVYGFGFRRYTTGTQALLNSTVQEFTPNGTITTTKNMAYEPTYNFLQSEETINSKNETIKATYSYPHNFIDQQPYSDMVNLKNILSPVIEQTTWKNNSFFLQSTKTNYLDWGNNITAPVTVVTQKGTNSPETRLHFYGYDALGNVLSVAKENGVMHSYAWGYNGRYPVAEVTGGTATTASGSVPQYTLDNATGDGDDATVRNALAPLLSIPNTVATTYTFKPLVGMTSQTDAAGRITYYEYDPMGRLSLVRDQDNNILKRYCYSYYNQTGACPDGPPAGATVFNSEDQSDYYYSNTCTSPAQPDPVYVTVPVGQCLSTVSVADANQQARQYGQNYANQNGTCTIPSSAIFTLTFNNTIDGTFDVNLTEVNTNQTYSVFVPRDGTTLQLPEGTYEVQIAPDVPPSSYYQFYFQVGCDYYGSSTWSIEFDNIPLNGNCNTITIN